MKRLYLFLLTAVFLFMCSCSSNNLPEDADSTQLQISDGASSSHTESNSSEESTASSHPDGTTAGISPTTDTRSDVKTDNTSRDSSPGTTKRPTAPDTNQSTGNQTSSGQSAATNPSKNPEASSTSPPVSSTPESPSFPEPKPPGTTSKPEPDMEAEYARIIRETIQYAESYAKKGFTFVWDDSLEFSWESGTGWMGTPRVEYEGVDGVIEMLQYHIDKIVRTVSDPGNGIPSHSAYYQVLQVMVDGDIAFVVLYG